MAVEWQDKKTVCLISTDGNCDVENTGKMKPVIANIRKIWEDTFDQL